MSKGSKLLCWTIAIALLALPACQREDPERKTEINLGEILPQSLRSYDVQRLDQSPEETRQWLVLYEYDLAGTSEFSPIAGVVYRADRGGINEPPVLFPYPLRPPDRDYLGTDTVQVTRRDVLTAKAGAELVVVNKNSDGFVTEAAIFYWHDPLGDEPWRPHSLEERYYQCMGFFRVNGQIKIEKDRAVVEEWARDRSQLALVHAYTPNETGSYLAEGATLHAPASSYIDFAFGQTGTVLDSPYPEKIVLAFYNGLGEPTTDLTAYLSENGQTLLDFGLVGYGCDWPPNQVANALVQEITYYPGVEAQTPQEQAQQALVELRVQCRSKTGETMLQGVQTGWFLVREKGQWKMDQVYRPTP
jgi:hypothetical protein